MPGAGFTQESPPMAGLSTAHQGNRRLLSTLVAVGDLDVTQPSLLPEWTVGHVLTHLARNADPFVRILRSATENGAGAPVPRWRRRAGTGHRARSRASGRGDHGGPRGFGTRRLTRPSRRCLRSSGTVWLAHRRFCAPLPNPPSPRWREVEVHHVDLGLGYQISDWPEAEFVSADLPHALDRVPERLGHAAQPCHLPGLGLRPHRLAAGHRSAAPC